MKKLESIQGIRGLAVLFVMLSHLMIIDKKNSSTPFLPDFLLNGNAGVDLFFVISGFIMVTITKDRGQNAINILQFLYKRISRIYPLYWLYATMAVFIFMIKPTWINHGETVNILSSYLLIPQNTRPLLVVTWSLTYELYFYLIFSLFLYFHERLLLVGLLLWAAILIVLESLIVPKTNLLHVLIDPLNFEFISGALVALMYYKFSLNKIRKRTLLFIFIMGILTIVSSDEVLMATQPFGFKRVLFFGVSAVFIVYSMLELERKGFTVPRLLVKIGDASYSIYLSHVFILSSLGRLIFKSYFGLFENCAVLLLLVISSISFGILSYQFIEKPLLQFFRKKRPISDLASSVPI